MSLETARALCLAMVLAVRGRLIGCLRYPNTLGSSRVVQFIDG